MESEMTLQSDAEVMQMQRLDAEVRGKNHALHFSWSENSLGICFVFKTVVSSYRSSNTRLKYSKWKEKALKDTQKPL